MTTRTWLPALAAVAWAGSWRVLYLEVNRWHHMDSRLRFTPPPSPPGAPVPHAGLPVLTARAVAVTAPVLTIALLLSAAGRCRTSPGRRGRRAG
ncbi:hypothetical protein [Amycolatopsis saalfeldensis]|uniref:hypothetical protein n=1 Tax=Amycolatopsis saalfeldensis TaxID=394193 RepID=UPI00116019FA|nr:hypothetical protein [Amycolatopsis saalfeldensis]